MRKRGNIKKKDIKEDVFNLVDLVIESFLKTSSFNDLSKLLDNTKHDYVLYNNLKKLLIKSKKIKKFDKSLASKIFVSESSNKYKEINHNKKYSIDE